MQRKNILVLSVQLWQPGFNREFFFFFFCNSEVTLWTVNKSLLDSKEEFEFISIGKLLPNTLAFWLIPLLKSQEFSLIKGKPKNKNTHTPLSRFTSWTKTSIGQIRPNYQFANPSWTQSFRLLLLAATSYLIPYKEGNNTQQLSQPTTPLQHGSLRD